MCKNKSKKAIVIVIALIGLGGIGTIIVFHLLPWQDILARVFMRGMSSYLQRKRVQLLYATNHQDLLDACRELSKQKAEGKLKRQMYNIRSRSNPEVAGFPRVILILRPNRIFINYDGRVMVEMMGGLDSFGVYAYPEGYEKPPHTTTLGDKKLMDGLWYYDDGYNANPEEYDKRIEALKPKARE